MGVIDEEPDKVAAADPDGMHPSVRAEIEARIQDPPEMWTVVTPDMHAEREREADAWIAANPWTTFIFRLPSASALDELVRNLPAHCDLGDGSRDDWWVEVYIDNRVMAQTLTTGHPYSQLLSLVTLLGGSVS